MNYGDRVLHTVGLGIRMQETNSPMRPHFLLSAVIALPLIVNGPVLAQMPGSVGHGMDEALPAHRARHAPLPSSLPAPKLVGEPSTRLLRPYSGTPIHVNPYHYASHS